jgi:hypothetical protein
MNCEGNEGKQERIALDIVMTKEVDQRGCVVSHTHHFKIGQRRSGF